MSTILDRTAADLTRAFAALDVRTDITANAEGVTVPEDGARRLLASLSFHEGGSAQPLVGHLLRRSRGDVTLHGDEGRHLWRALKSIALSRRRSEQIDRGQIPGALSGAEAMRLARKHPHMFSGRR